MSKNWTKIGILLLIVLVAVAGIAMVGVFGIESHIVLPSEEMTGIEPMLPVTMECKYSGDNCDVCYKLCDIIPIKRVSVALTDDEVYLGGQPLGIDMQLNGLIVTDIMKVVTAKGIVEPLADADIRQGDLLTHVNAVSVKSMDDVQQIVNEANGAVVLSVKRDNNIIHIPVTAAKDCLTNQYKLGLYVRNGIQGIGTLTFVKPSTMRYGALGHVIKDETGKTFSEPSGLVYDADILGVVKGERGKAGELSGYFDSRNESLGTIDKNCDQGIFGEWKSDFSGLSKIKLGSKYSVHPGKAYIYTTINGNKPQKYEIEIIKNSVQSQSKTRGLLIRVTDEKLLAESGGIVQGMSGSPIIQDNKLVGAVTHVFIGDPTKGYGTYIDWMIADSVKK